MLLLNIMTAANQQIVTAFEDAGLTPEQIAEDLEFDLLAVKAILTQYSTKFRSESKKDDALAFKIDEAEEMKSIILGLARYSDDEHLQFKAAKFVLEDKKGRLDLNTKVPGLQINVVTFNEQMKRALQAEQRTLERNVPIEVEELVPA